MRTWMLAIALFALPALAQEKPADPAKDTVALNAKQADELQKIYDEAEIVGKNEINANQERGSDTVLLALKERIARLERESVQLRFNLMLRRFMDDLKLSSPDWQFNEEKRVFIKKKQEEKKP